MKITIAVAAPRVRRSAVGQLWALFLILMLAGVGWAQESETHLIPFEEGHGLPSGLRVNRVTTYSGVFDLTVPDFAGPTITNRPLGMVIGGGMSADIGWYLPGRLTEAYVDLGFAYDGNWKYHELNGGGFRLSMGVQRKLSPSATFSLRGLAESSTLAEYVFGATQSSTLSGLSYNASQLSAGLSDRDVSAGTGATPLGLSLFGARRQDAAIEATLVIVRSPRFSWHFGTSLMRNLPADIPVTGQLGSVAYPGVTTGTSSAGFTYALSRRTQVGIDGTYSRSFSSFDKIHVMSGTAGLQHMLGRQWFAHLRAGYGLLGELQTVAKSPMRREYYGDAGIGAKLLEHTFLLTVSRSIADSYGLRAGNTTGGELAWIWHRPGGNWTLRNSAIYERLGGRSVEALQGWLYQGEVLRQLSRQTSLGVQVVYAADSGRLAGGGFTNLMRRGVRMTLTWTPDAERTP